MSDSYGRVGEVKCITIDAAFKESAVVLHVFEEGVQISPIELTATEAYRLADLLHNALRRHEFAMRMHRR
ncbi:MAG: hypothetical protein V3T08_09905 [Gemmatimonadota bacterium]